MSGIHTNAPVDTVEYGQSVIPQNRVELLKRRCRRQLDCMPGDVLEVGVYRGGTLFVLAEEARRAGGGRVIGIDTFKGHPYTDGHPVHPSGKYSDVSRAQLEKLIAERGFADIIQLHTGLVEDVLGSIDVSRVSFAHIDCDLEQPIEFCAKHLAHRLPIGASIYFDDYLHEHCPGATAAVRRVFGNVPAFHLNDHTEWSCEIRIGPNRTAQPIFDSAS
jgi:hypothetical protein